MSRHISRWIMILNGLALASWLLMLPYWPDGIPWCVLAALIGSLWPLARAWRAAAGTALRPAIAWAAIAVTLGMIAQVQAFDEPIQFGRPLAGHWAYLSAVATLAELGSVLNARRPGNRVWALLMIVLFLVFLIPWVENGGLRELAGPGDRLRLAMPWSLFYGVLGMVGVLNYQPTRYAPAALWIALGLALEYCGLTYRSWSFESRAWVWSAVPWCFAMALWTAELQSRQSWGPPGPTRLWLMFRDSWGSVWALRMQERFNQSARALNWPVSLEWDGLSPGADADLAAAEATLTSLLRRFASPAWLAGAAAGPVANTCPSPPIAGS